MHRGTSRMGNRAPVSRTPTVGLCVEPYGGPRGGAISYESGTPVNMYFSSREM